MFPRSLRLFFILWSLAETIFVIPISHLQSPSSCWRAMLLAVWKRYFTALSIFAQFFRTSSWKLFSDPVFSRGEPSKMNSWLSVVCLSPQSRFITLYNSYIEFFCMDFHLSVCVPSRLVSQESKIFSQQTRPKEAPGPRHHYIICQALWLYWNNTGW